MLTDDEIKSIADSTQSAEPGSEGYILPFTFARAIESATIATLARGVSVEPDVMTYDHGDHRLPLYSHSPKQLQTAIAAARVQENERIAKWFLEYFDDPYRANAIRALIGKEST